MVTPSDQVYCYHYNAIGSTIAMTDQSQTVVNKYVYDAFGTTANQVEAVSQPFKYVGGYGVMTEPNGFYYMRARYYDPNVGRFISEDPSGFDGGDVNLYAYVESNPINLIDPYGLLAPRTMPDPGIMDQRNLWSPPPSPDSLRLVENPVGNSIIKSMIFWTIRGAVTGAIAGVPEAGVGAVPGAIIGGGTGAIFGAGRGFISGAVKGMIKEALFPEKPEWNGEIHYVYPPYVPSGAYIPSK